jgi:hypothetical protein
VKFDIPFEVGNEIADSEIRFNLVFNGVQVGEGGEGFVECTANADCDDGNVCTEDICSGGVCQHNCQIDSPCNDGNSATVYDKCVLTATGCECIGEIPECTQDSDCDDGNHCTQDVCSNYHCQHSCQVDSPCDDGDINTVYDKCLLTTTGCECVGETP